MIIKLIQFLAVMVCMAGAFLGMFLTMGNTFFWLGVGASLVSLAVLVYIAPIFCD